MESQLQQSPLSSRAIDNTRMPGLGATMLQNAPLSARAGTFHSANNPLPATGDDGASDNYGDGTQSARGNSRQPSRQRVKSGASLAPSVPAGPESKMSKAEFEARRKRKETQSRHDHLQEQRDADKKAVKERAERANQDREKRFKDMMDTIMSETSLRVDAAREIRQFEREQDRKRHGLYNKWDAEVNQRVQSQLNKFMADDAVIVQDGWRDELRRTDCPVRRDVIAHQKEEEFHRAANAILHTAELYANEEVKLKDLPRHRENRVSAMQNRARSRPVMPIEQWAQAQHYSTRFGYFSQASERAEQSDNHDVGFHSARRQGYNAHMIDESDGVPAAGKTKSRFERNKMGMLEGDLARCGESARHKRDHGAGSAAPLQDHYSYERGNAIVDAEFPVGKRVFPHMSRV